MSESWTRHAGVQWARVIGRLVVARHGYSEYDCYCMLSQRPKWFVWLKVAWRVQVVGGGWWVVSGEWQASRHGDWSSRT